MATGDFRREVVQSGLGNTSDLRQGVGLNTPVAVGGVTRPAGVQGGFVSTDAMNSIAEWGGAAIKKEAAKEWNKSLLDGQMAHQQGVAMSEIETGGDKWKLEGYHQMEAQTLMSSFLAAQKAEIANSAYAMSPEEYRAQQVDRLGAMLEGKDPRVQDLITKQMATQMPALATAHIEANTAYSTQRTYEAAVTAVGVVSQDDTATDKLIAMADGAGMEGLGPNEQREALTEGIIAAFQSGNPNAYIHLKTAGKLDGFTPEQLQRIEGGRSGFMQKQRETWSVDKAEKFDEYYIRVENGDFATPMDAAKAYASLWSEYGVDISAQEGYREMTAARTGIGMRQQTTANNIETAVISQDYGAAAQMALPSLVNMESGGSYTVLGPDTGNGNRAVGKYQIMMSNIPSWTLAHLGRSMTWQEFRDNPAAQDAVFEGQFGGYIKNRVAKGQSPMEAVRDAVSMWHSGRPYDEAVADGAADVNMSTRDYTDKIMAGMTGTPNAQQRYEASVAGLTDARAVAAQASYEQLAPARNDLDRAYERGQIGKDEWLTERRNLYTKYGMQRTEADVNSEIQITNTIQDEAFKAAKTAEDQQKIQVVSAQLSDAENRMYSVVNNPDASLADRQAAIGTYVQERGQIYSQAGLPTTIEQNMGFNREMRGVWDKAIEADKVATENMSAVIAAANAGTLGNDPTVDSKTRSKWWDKRVAGIQQNARDAVARNPKMSEQDAVAMAQTEIVKTMADTGYVPPEMKAMYSSALSVSLLDKNGNATPQAISAVTDYMTLRTKNPRAAAAMLDEAALATAEQIAALAGNNVMGIASAIQQRELSGTLIRDGQMPSEILAHEGAIATIDKSVASFFGDDTWFSRGIDAYREHTDDPSMRGLLQSEIARVTLEKFAASGARGSPTPLVEAAREEVLNRSAILGGDLVIAQRGIDIAAETFGPGNANITGNSGQKAAMMSDPSSVDNAMRQWIYDNAGKEGTGVPAEATKFWSETATPIEGMLDIPGAMLTGIGKSAAGIVPMWDERGARLENIDYEVTGFRQTGEGTVMQAHIYLPNGGVSVVSIPLAQAGSAYMRTLQTQ